MINAEYVPIVYNLETRDKVLEIIKVTEKKERELILKVDTFFGLASGKVNEILVQLPF